MGQTRSDTGQNHRVLIGCFTLSTCRYVSCRRHCFLSAFQSTAAQLFITQLIEVTGSRTPTLVPAADMLFLGKVSRGQKQPEGEKKAFLPPAVVLAVSIKLARNKIIFADIIVVFPQSNPSHQSPAGPHQGKNDSTDHVRDQLRSLTFQ